MEKKTIQLQVTSSLGDKIWVMRNNRPIEFEVYIIEYIKDISNGDTVIYQAKSENIIIRIRERKGKFYNENGDTMEVFSTKEELICSLY